MSESQRFLYTVTLQTVESARSETAHWVGVADDNRPERPRIIDLDAARAERVPLYDGQTCECGSAWFVTAVTLNEHGFITGFSVDDMKCQQCGRVPTGPVAGRII